MYIKRVIIKSVIASLKKGVNLNKAIRESGCRSVVTFWNWRESNPRLKRAIKRAQEVCDVRRVGMVEDALFKNALDGNVAAQIFFLKNRKSDTWRDKQVIESLGAQQVTQIYLPERKSGKPQIKQVPEVSKSRIDGL